MRRHNRNQSRRIVLRQKEQIKVKLIKMLGLAVVAAVAVAAFAGSASAARLHPLVKLCLENQLLLCPNAKTAKLEGVLIGLQIGTGTLEGTINQKCTGGKIEGKTGEMTQGPGAEESKLLGETTKLTFTGCEPCKKITTSPPFTTNLKMTAETGGWTLEGKGNAKFEECSFGVVCKFGSEKLTPEPIVEMTATEAIVNTNKAVLNREEGNEFFCGNTGKWNAKYTLDLELKAGSGVTEKVWPTLCKELAAECL